MQDGTVAIESSHGRMASIGRTPVGCHSRMVQVYTLSKVVRSIAIVTSSVMDMSPDSFVLKFWDFLPSPCR
jgi:hypothetical protein